MKGDAGSDGGGGERDGSGPPYPLPGEDWGDAGDGSAPAAGPASTPPLSNGDASSPGVALSKERPAEFRFPLGGRTVGAEKRRMWLFMFVPFLAVMLLVVGIGGYKIYRVSTDPAPAVDLGSEPPFSLEPEPVSTAKPRVAGWKAVTHPRYRMRYDVPPSWRVRKTELLVGYEAAGGEDRAMMSGSSALGLRFCAASPANSRALAGFQQYVEGGLAAVAEDAARKWATDAYTAGEKGAATPAITMKAPKTVRVGGAKSVLVHADVVAKSFDACSAKTAGVDVLAMPGAGPGKTTVFVLLHDTGVPGAAPAADLRKIIGSVRPAR